MKKETSEKIVKAGKQLMMPEKGIRVVTTTATGAVNVTQLARPAAVPLEVKMALRKDIRRDEDQPRKTFDEGKLQDLAESIRAVGIRTPLQVEWVSELKLHEPDLVEKKWTVLDARGPMNAGKTKFRGEEKDAREYLAANPSGFYRLVDGERRWRAAELAEVERVPVMVVDTSAPEWPQQKLAIQVVLNQQHENLSALEEAAAYRKEIEAGRHTAESLYKALGVSRAHLFGRLALNRLPDFAVKALEEGRINTSVAGLIPMIPKEDQQKAFLGGVAGTEWRQPMSFREAQDMMEEDFCRQLKEAPFDLKDGELVPAEWIIRSGSEDCGLKEFKAKGKEPILTTDKGAFVSSSHSKIEGGTAVVEGIYGDQFAPPEPGSSLAAGPKVLPILVDGLSKKDAKEVAILVAGKCLATPARRIKGGACTDCPMRSGNLAEYPDAGKRPNVCTAPQCYHEKVKAHWVRKAGDAVKAGATVLDLTTYKRTKGEYVEAEKNGYYGNTYTSAKAALGKKAPAAILATTETGLIKVYKREEAVAAGLKLNRGATTAEDRAKEEAKREKREAMKEGRNRLVKDHAAQVAIGIRKLSDGEAWKLAAEVCDTGGGAPFRGEMKKAVNSVRDQFLCEVMSTYHSGVVEWDGNWDMKMVKRWKELGVDLLKLEAAAIEEEKGKATSVAKLTKEAKGNWEKAKAKGANKGKK